MSKVARLGFVNTSHQPAVLISAGIDERREQETDGRNEPEQAEEHQDEVDGRLPEEANDPRRVVSGLTT